MRWMRHGAAFIVLITPLLLVVGCQGMPARFGSPTLTPVLLPRSTQPPITSVSDQSEPTVADAPAAMPALAPGVIPATGDALANPTSTGTSATRVMVLGTRPTISLRTEPSATAPIIAQVPGASIFWAEGRDANGGWLWVVRDGDGAGGWVAAGDLKLYSEVSALPLMNRSATVAPATPANLPTASGAPIARATRAAPQALQLTGKVVFQAATGGDIYLLPASGGKLRKLTNGLDPALSPDGTQVAFARWGAAPGIYVINLATGQERLVAGAERPRSPSWSGDSARIVFARFISATSCRQSPFGCLTDDALRTRFGGRECVPSPAGQLCIADFPLVQLERSGLTEIGAEGQSWLDLPAPNDPQSPAWQPGSAQILFLGDGRLQTTTREDRPAALAADTWTTSPAWSPDGSRIAAQRRVHDTWEIMLLAASGVAMRQLTVDEANNVSPVWSPDGKSILFLSDRDGRWRLYRMNADGSGQVLFRPDVLNTLEIRYNFAAERVASWSP